MAFSEKDVALISDAIVPIYSVRDLKSMRTTFLDNIKGIIPYDSAMFDFAKTNEFNQWHFFDAVCINIGDGFINQYYSRFQQIDYVHLFFSQSRNNVYRDTDLMKDSVREKTEIYNDWMKPLGVHFGSVSSISRNGIILGSVALFRAKNSIDFTKKELFVLNILNQHLASRLFQLFPKGINYKNYHNAASDTGIILKYHLTEREHEVIDLLLEGLNNVEIGEKIFVTESTVKKHLSNIFDKFGVKSRTQLIKILMPQVVSQ